MKLISIALSFAIIVTCSKSQDKSIDLYDLAKFNVVDTTDGNYFELATIYYNANLATVFNSIDSNSNDGYYNLISTKLNNNSKQIFHIDFCECDSHDPTFYLYQEINGNKVELNTISATNIKIPGDGFIYFNGRANDYFDRYSKYAFDGKEFKEVAQPYYYVGVKSRVNKTLTLYYDDKLTKPITVLANKSKVTVVLSKTDKLYLLKTIEGILGWVKIEHADMVGERDIQDIYIMGD